MYGDPLPNADAYSEQTRAWFETWRRAPQAVHFTVTDWQRLHMLAPLVDQYLETPTTKLMAEIRLNEERLGATPIDRLRLGYRMVSPASGRPHAGGSLERARRASEGRTSSRDRLPRIGAGSPTTDTEEAG